MEMFWGSDLERRFGDSPRLSEFADVVAREIDPLVYELESGAHHLRAGKRLAGRWFTYLGLPAAALIAVGVLVPLDAPGTDFANFVGYIIWSIWLVVFAVPIWRRAHVERPVAEQPAT